MKQTLLKYKNPKRVPVGKNGRKETQVTATCVCGKEFLVYLHNLQGGKGQKSCGCLIRIHSMSGTKPHSSWLMMRHRCNNSNYGGYKNYGARGIKVCKRWDSFILFWKDMGNSYKQGLTLDRINVNGNYEPKNCRWITMAEQQKNRRDTIKFKGECAKDASIRLGGEESLVATRVKRGWSKEKAFTKIPLKRKK